MTLINFWASYTGNGPGFDRPEVGASALHVSCTLQLSVNVTPNQLHFLQLYCSCKISCKSEAAYLLAFKFDVP